MKLLRLSQLLLLLAILLSGWLTYESITASIGCGAGGDCSAVVTSPWAKLLGIPIALLGLFTYLVLLVLTQCRPFHSRMVNLLSSTFCLLIIGSALWFTALQAVIIRSFCPFCCVIHSLGTLASLLLLGQLFTRYQDRENPPPVFLPLMLSFIMVAGMVSVQFLTPAPQQSAVISAQHHKHGAAETPLLFSLNQDLQPIFQGQTSTSLTETLSLGPKSDAPIALGYLYDWTCEYCLALHQLLHELAANPGELEHHFQVTLLPHSHTPEGREIHRLLASAKQANPENYDILQLELHHQILPAELESVRQRVHELAPDTVSALENTSEHTMTKTQLLHNQQTLHLDTVPQLFGVYSALTGNPTQQELLSFLNNAAREQALYLQSLEQ